MNFLFVFKVVGIFVSVLGVAMFVPAAIDFNAHNPDWKVFFISGSGTIASGLLLYFLNRQEETSLNIRESYLLTFISWASVSAFGAIPFYLSNQDISLVNAFFETVSGLTTTGSTIFSGLDGLPPGILFWRAILHWIGGIVIIVLAIGILPFLGVGGMRMFHTESSDQSEKPVPRTKNVIQGIIGIYVVVPEKVNRACT